MLTALRRTFALFLALAASCHAAAGVDKPVCTRPLSLALHEHGLLYSAQTGEGIDRDIADELMRRSGCTINVSLMSRTRIWQLIESGALDFSLTGISSDTRESFAAFAWYETNRFYLLVRKDAGAKSLAEFERNPALRLGGTRGYRYGPNGNRFVDGLDAARRVTFASSLEALFPALLDNRVQGMIIEPFDYPVIEDGPIRQLTTLLDIDDAAVPHGLIMSKKSLSIVQQEAWRAIVNEMRADGTMQRIFERYFSPEMARALTHF